MERRIVCPVSANPPTWGHADIMARGAKMFDRLYWAVGKNPDKSIPFDGEQQKQMLEVYVRHYGLDNVMVESFEGTAVGYAVKCKARYFLRGLRSGQDFQGEWELAWGNKGISEEMETIFLFCRPDLAPVSSSIVRQLAGLGENIERYVHPEIVGIVEEALRL